MHLNFIYNKRKIITFLFISSFCINNASWADTEQNGGLITDLSENKILNSTDKIVDNQSVPAVEIKNNKDNFEEPIVPVLDLKGGIQKQAEKKETPLEIWLHEDKATGDWHGLRSRLEESGITVSGSYMMNSFTKQHSGGLLENSKASYMGLVNTSVELDTEKMHLYPGGKLFVMFQNIHGKGLTEKYVGDYMFFNGYDSPRTGPQLSEYWYEQSLFNNKLKAKIGKQDANAEFMAMNTGFEFIHSGFNFIVNSYLPTYPNAAIGITATLQPIDKLYLKYGLFDANGVGSQSGFNTVFHKDGGFEQVGEIGVTDIIKNHPGKYVCGVWLNTKNREEVPFFDQTGDLMVYTSNHGIYTEFEQMLFKEKRDDTEDSQGLTLMGQFAWSPPTRSDITKYFGTAVTYRGLVPKRDNDTLGVGVNFAHFSNRIGNIKGENVLEVFYKIRLTPWLYIQPDFQYINKPFYADKGTIVFGIRTNIDF